jgi:two-component system chemotaxis response regulator CheB
MLDDGTAGLQAIKQRGGLAVVQDPADALFPDMPTNALRRVKQIDAQVPLVDLVPLLIKWVSQVPNVPDRKETQTVDEQLEIEDEFAMSNIPDRDILNKIGKPATIACPECHGTLWEVDDKDLLRFRCRVGHSYTAQSLMAEHADSLESALWIAMRTLEESASLNRRLAERAQNDQLLLSASKFIENAVQSAQQADLIRQVLMANKAVGGESGH